MARQNVPDYQIEQFLQAIPSQAAISQCIEYVFSEIAERARNDRSATPTELREWADRFAQVLESAALATDRFRLRMSIRQDLAVLRDKAADEFSDLSDTERENVEKRIEQLRRAYDELRPVGVERPKPVDETERRKERR